MYNELFDKIIPDENLKLKTIERVEVAMNPKKSKTKLFYALVATFVFIIGTTTVFAASPTARQAISDFMSYFQSDRAIEISSLEELGKYNEDIGKSASNHGFTLTIDNLASDDNFIHVFYTIKSDKPYYSGELVNGRVSEENIVTTRPYIDCRIDGILLDYYSNNNYEDGYYLDNFSYKGVKKFNISNLTIDDSFKLELYSLCESQKASDSDVNYKNETGFEPTYLQEKNLVLTKDDISKLLYVDIEANKSDVKISSLIKDTAEKFQWEDVSGEVTKLVLSPFGNQLVIKNQNGNKPIYFALFDEKDVSLDVLNIGSISNDFGDPVENSFEFLKAGINTKSLTLVPVKFKDNLGEAANSIVQKIGVYPMTYELSDYGKIVITDIRIENGAIDIDYYKDGFTLFDPGFQLMDDKGNNAEPGGKLGCTLYTRVHRDTNSYTAQYICEKLDDDVLKAKLTENFTSLGIFKDENITLDYSNNIKINLK